MRARLPDIMSGGRKRYAHLTAILQALPPAVEKLMKFLDPGKQVSMQGGQDQHQAVPSREDKTITGSL